jgi:hypothetical protein
MPAFSAALKSHEVEYGGDLLARHVELLHDLVNAEVFEVLDDGSHRQAGTFEHPGAAHLPGDALDGGAPRPPLANDPEIC